MDVEMREKKGMYLLSLHPEFQSVSLNMEEESI